MDAIAAAVEAHRSPDGGYAKKAGATMGSTYHTFLAALVYEMIQRPLPEPERIAGFLKNRLRDDGGFAELPVMKRSGANPTAAAVALAGMLGADADLTRGAEDALVALQSPVEGGFHANRSAPAADLLSTFTALLTLEDLGVMDRDARRMRGERPWVMTNLKTGVGLDEVIRFIEKAGCLRTD